MASPYASVAIVEEHVRLLSSDHGRTNLSRFLCIIVMVPGLSFGANIRYVVSTSFPAEMHDDRAKTVLSIADGSKSHLATDVTLDLRPRLLRLSPVESFQAEGHHRWPVLNYCAFQCGPYEAACVTPVIGYKYGGEVFV